ncbi:glycosyltransferase [Vibrio lentus]|uniref:Glycosyltransferase n=1 Tax=Vibrio lentus TaxID=136468 RepID=A0A2N7III8_9VIBR|nr:glycosyltransferase [Vibrio lentus]PML57434.1 hypothetical protein BCT74_19425 [Vibrio lentus]PMM24842.1 hypothetical protein BCT58_11270 [Vibrio lentus]
MKNILYVHYGDDNIRGAESRLINLVESLDRNRYKPFVWSNCEPLIERLTNSEVPNHYSPFHLMLGQKQPKFNVIGWCRQVNQAITLIKQHDIDVIHINNGAPCQWMCLAAKLCKIPLVTQLHNNYRLRDRFTFGLHLSPCIVGVSYDVCEGLLDDDYPQDQLSVIYNGVAQDLHQKIDLRTHLNIPASSYVFITAGPLIVSKGIDLIVQALNIASQDHDCHLVVIGKGEDRENLELLINSSGLNERVHLVGEQNNTADWLYGGADAFISGARYEAFGHVIAEAGLAKLPIIAPRIGGIPEFINHEGNGLLFSTHNPINEMTEHMLSLITQPQLGSRLGNDLYELTASSLTVIANTQRFQRLYEKIYAEPSSMSLACSLKPVLRWAFR